MHEKKLKKSGFSLMQNENTKKGSLVTIIRYAMVLSFFKSYHCIQLAWPRGYKTGVQSQTQNKAQ